MILTAVMQPQLLEQVKQKPQLIAVFAVAGTTNVEETEFGLCRQLNHS